MNKNKEKQGNRLAKVIARSGHCSRREAEKLIKDGEVKVNGKIVTDVATNVTDEAIKVHNKLINQKEKTRLWIFHKPKGIVVTRRDPQKRRTIFDILPAVMKNIIVVGRLDINTEGLILLTNNGDLSRFIELPSTGWTRIYRARVFGKLNMNRLNRLQTKGVTINNIHYAPMKVQIEKEGISNSWLKISVIEGKNREIKRILEHYDLKVTRLIRVSFGCFHLGNIATGLMKEVPYKIIKDMVGNKVEI
ncbi:pseudouridine synthase [Pseudomonadota bacterium]